MDQTANFSNFLVSDVVILKTENGSRTFKIHIDLLGDKSEVILAGFDKRFNENDSGMFICTDTSEETLSRFVEWAYRGDYQVEADSMLNHTDFAPPYGTDTGNNISMLTATELASEVERHPLFSHLLLYIFGDIYLISPLKHLAFAKIMEYLRMTGRLLRVGSLEVIVAVFATAFAKLPDCDPFLTWIAQYGVWCIQSLRLHQSFMELLKTTPHLSVRLISAMEASQFPPWATQGLCDNQLPENMAAGGDVNFDGW
ncbi:hypothetical protein BDV59DRAFT_203978 [Aspergillus ambiguus]|uniref:uncharacterized protein n=1 Tax=Aspergillus ambiguus TaxID=176160 RepID=UPI003CCD7A92